MTTVTRPSLLARLLTGGALLLAGALLAFALIPNLVGAQTAEEGTTPAPEQARDGRPGHLRPGTGGIRAAEITAGLTGTTIEDVMAAIQEGASLAGYAAGYDVSRDELVEAILAGAQEDLDARVSEGSITRERADELLVEMGEKVESLVDREGVPAKGMPGCGQDGSGEEADTSTI